MPAGGSHPPASGMSEGMSDDGAARQGAAPAPGDVPGPVGPGSRLGEWARRRPRLMDALAILLVAGSVLLSLSVVRSGWGYLAFGLVSAVLLWWRRSHPLLTTAGTVVISLACTAVAGTPGDATFAAAFAFYSVLAARGPRVAWTALLAATALVTGAVLAWGTPSALVPPTSGDIETLDRVEYLLVTMITVVAMWSVALMIATTVRARRLGLQPPIEEDLRKRGPVRRFARRHPWVMDVLVVVVFLGVNVLSAAAIDADSAYISIMAACAVALMWRRHRPLSVLAALTLLGMISILVLGHSGDVELGVAFALYTVVTVRGTRLGWAALVATAVIAIGSLVLWGTTDAAQTTGAVTVSVDRTTYISSVAASQLIMWLVAVAIGMNVQGRRQQIARLVDQARQYRLERDQRELLAASSERARIAREMHDVVAHSLSVMVALSDGARASVDKAPQRSAQALDELSSTGRAALGDMRRILGVLRSEPTEAEASMLPQPGAPALEDLVQRFRAAGLEVAFVRSGPSLPEDAALQMTVYRMIQEGLTNVLRHAPETSGIEVRLERSPGQVVLSVRNNRPARPTQPRSGGGQGLVGMRQRAATYDGTVEAGPHEGGWLMRAHLYFSEAGTGPAGDRPVAAQAEDAARAEDTERAEAAGQPEDADETGDR